MKSVCIIMVCMLGALPVMAQSGAIQGNVKDEKSEPMTGAVVYVFEGGLNKGGAVTDINGNYVVKPVQPGRYEVRIAYTSYETHVTTGVIVSPNKITTVDCQMRVNTKEIEEVTVIAYKVPLIDKYAAGTSTTLTSETIDKMPARSTRSMAATTAGIATSDEYVSSYTEGVSVRTSKEVSPDASSITAGKLTSGEVNDFGKWKLWNDLADEELKIWSHTWKIFPRDRYTVMIINSVNRPVTNAVVKLQRTGEKRVIWEALTDNTGKAELWNRMFLQDDEKGQLYATISYKGEVYKLEKIKPFAKGINMLRLPVTCDKPTELDVAFVVDATGSMQDEINYLKAELLDIIGNVHDSLPELDLQTGCIFYRDEGDEYVTRTSAMDKNINTTLDFIKANNAGGGGDGPEAVEKALRAAYEKLDWRKDAIARIVFLVLDAPPHSDDSVIAQIKKLTAQYAQRGIRIVPVTCSGIDKSTEYLMRSLALATNGTYLFLTNHSGIGGGHIEPSTDKYDVEYMNKLIFRIIYQFSHMQPCDEQTDIIPDTSVVSNEKKEAAVDSSSTSQDSEKPQADRTDIKFYPNPTTGILHITCKGMPGDLFITDISGKLMMKLKTNGEGKAIANLSQYPAGIYFVKYLYGNNKWLSGKFTLIH